MSVRTIARLATVGLSLLAAAVTAWGEAARSLSFRPMYESGHVEFVEDVRFGNDDDDDPGVLYRPLGYCVDAEGNVFVLDYHLTCVKKFNRDGEYVRTFSRRGEGPGELARPRNLTVTADGRVVVFNLSGHRFSVFSNDGDYLDAHRFNGSVRQLESAPDGSIIAMFRFLQHGWVQKGALYKVMRFSPDLSAHADIDSAYVKIEQVVHETDDAIMKALSPFVTQPHVAVSPLGRIVVGHSEAYVLKVLSLDLEPVRKIERDAGREPITERDREDYLSRYADDPNFQILVRENVKFPKYKPFFKRIAVDHEGHIIVEIYADPAPDGRAVHDVFDPAGDFVNRVTMRSGLGFRDGFAYAMMTGEREAPAVVRYRAVRPESDD